MATTLRLRPQQFYSYPLLFSEKNSENAAQILANSTKTTKGMQTMKDNTIPKYIATKTVSLEEVFQDFTPEQEKIAEAEMRYYDVLLELKKLRNKLGLTQAELAQKALLPRTTISKIESGSYNPTLNTLMSIAAALNKNLRIQFE